MPEFVVFHLQRGIQHIYMYDGSQNAVVSSGMHNFIEAGLLTTVAWPYSQCDQDACTKPLMYKHFNEIGQEKGEWIDTLPAMSHRAALDSCYSRFSQFATWMGSWDIDEFAVPLSFPTYQSLLAPYTNNDSVASVSMKMFYMKPASACTSGELVKLASAADQMHGSSVAPLSADGPRLPVASEVCPEVGMFHLGSWCLRYKRGHPFAPKQFFKTSHVWSHTIHYLGAHTHGQETEANPETEARLHHYKLPDPHSCRGPKEGSSSCLEYMEPSSTCSTEGGEGLLVDTTSLKNYLAPMKEGLHKWYPNLIPAPVLDDKHDNAQLSKRDVSSAYHMLTANEETAPVRLPNAGDAGFFISESGHLQPRRFGK